MNNQTPNKKTKLTHYIKAPYRVLVKARDAYVNSMTGYAARVSSSGVSRGRTQQGFHQSYTKKATASQEDISELIRAASQGRVGGLNNGGAVPVVPRSQSVAVTGSGGNIGRIDEDEECEFGEEYTYPRSMSCAVVHNGRKIATIGA